MAIILIVDDHPATRLLVKQILTNQGHQVIEAEDGRSACSKAVSDKPDLILMDVNMPVLDGFQALERLKGSPATRLTPVIMLTSGHLPQNELQGVRKGALDYITKPWGPGELEDRIRMGLTYLESRTHGRAPPEHGTAPTREDGSNNSHKTLSAQAQSLQFIGSKPGRSLIRRARRSFVRDVGTRSTLRGDDEPRAKQIEGHQRPYLEEVARNFIRQKYERIRGIKFTRVTQVGPIAGLNVYQLEGITTVLLGNIPSLQAKGFNLTIRITFDGRVVDRRGRVL